jgi:two-component system OmpR family sensor kinase
VARQRRYAYTSFGRSTLGAGDMLLMALPLGPPGGVVGYAILGRSLATTNDTITRIRSVYTLGALIVLAVAALLSLPLLNRALRPLHRVAATAEAIAAGDLEQRANLTRTRDEVGRLGIAFDTMVDRLQAALSAATASEERMRRFLADASHELRTPLTALRGTAQVLLRQGGSGRPEVDLALQAMHDETVRLSRLVDDLLTLSRLDAGQPLDPQSVTLRPFLEGFVERYGGVWPSRTIRVDTAAIDGSTVFADPEALRRILTNLVDNAARYSQVGKPITLACRTDTACVTIQVRDEGPGLDPAEAARIFERFYRGNKSRSRQSGGSGLGLAIVDALVKESGGHIQVDTAPQRGTTVAVTLPRAA